VNNLKSCSYYNRCSRSTAKGELVDEQEIVMNLADILAMAFIAESAF